MFFSACYSRINTNSINVVRVIVVSRSSCVHIVSIRCFFISILRMLAGGGLYASHSEVTVNGHTYMAFNDAYDGGE